MGDKIDKYIKKWQRLSRKLKKNAEKRKSSQTEAGNSNTQDKNKS